MQVRVVDHERRPQRRLGPVELAAYVAQQLEQRHKTHEAPRLKLRAQRLPGFELRQREGAHPRACASAWDSWAHPPRRGSVAARQHGVPSLAADRRRPRPSTLEQGPSAQRRRQHEVARELDTARDRFDLGTLGEQERRDPIR